MRENYYLIDQECCGYFYKWIFKVIYQFGIFIWVEIV